MRSQSAKSKNSGHEEATLAGPSRGRPPKGRNSDAPPPALIKVAGLTNSPQRKRKLKMKKNKKYKKASAATVTSSKQQQIQLQQQQQQQQQEQLQALEQQQQNSKQGAESFIMKLFDRGLDLSKYTESTPLYPICRAWMLNQPRNANLIQNYRDRRTPSPVKRESNGEELLAKLQANALEDVKVMPAPKGTDLPRIPVLVKEEKTDEPENKDKSEETEIKETPKEKEESEEEHVEIKQEEERGEKLKEKDEKPSKKTDQVKNTPSDKLDKVLEDAKEQQPGCKDLLEQHMGQWRKVRISWIKQRQQYINARYGINQLIIQKLMEDKCDKE